MIGTILVPHRGDVGVIDTILAPHEGRRPLPFPPPAPASTGASARTQSLENRARVRDELGAMARCSLCSPHFANLDAPPSRHCARRHAGPRSARASAPPSRATARLCPRPRHRALPRRVLLRGLAPHPNEVQRARGRCIGAARRDDPPREGDLRWPRRGARQRGAGALVIHHPGAQLPQPQRGAGLRR